MHGQINSIPHAQQPLEKEPHFADGGEHDNFRSRMVASKPYFDTRSTLVVASATIALSYLVPHLVARFTSNPQTVWPLWPGCAILVTGLLLVRVAAWPVIIVASFISFAVADLQAGVPLSSIVRF